MFAFASLPDLDPARALDVSFFDRDPVEVARELLGMALVRQLPGGPRLAARIVETEAYDCPRDPSCHVIARLPGAAQALGGAPGRIYFHAVYQHALLNVVCRESGVQAAILIRAAEPLLGEDTMREFRPVKRRLDLTNGPAKLMTALSITPDLDGQSADGPELYFVPGEPVPDAEVTTTPRIGLRLGADLPWRFLITGNPWVSPGRPAGV